MQQREECARVVDEVIKTNKEMLPLLKGKEPQQVKAYLRALQQGYDSYRYGVIPFLSAPELLQVLLVSKRGIAPLFDTYQQCKQGQSSCECSIQKLEVK